MLPLFDEPLPVHPTRAVLQRRLPELARQGVLFGTSSWKYEGWLGSIYSESRYLTRGRFSKKKFAETCLQEYAEVFPIVCGDFSFYQFPSESFWRNLFTTSPEQLRFAFKVPEQITVKSWPQHARYGALAGQENPFFLNPDLFRAQFLDLLLPYRKRIDVLIIEFGQFSRKSLAEPAEFLEVLNSFLAALPEEFRYAVEIRNAEFFHSGYFRVLHHHRVAHVFNAWTRMPELPEQIADPEAFTTDFTLARALLRVGRPYEQAVAQFQPYTRVQETNEGARTALRALLQRALESRQRSYLFVNNRLEGYAPGTIEAVVGASP